jgi:hypothetical protein
MIVSTIVFIPKLPENRANLFDKIINQSAFEEIALDTLTSIDFEIITYQANTRWERDTNPTLLDEESGAILLHISKEGLEAVINFEGELDNVDIEIQKTDIVMLKNFIERFGFDNLYECVTF